MVGRYGLAMALVLLPAGMAMAQTRPPLISPAPASAAPVGLGRNVALVAGRQGLLDGSEAADPARLVYSARIIDAKPQDFALTTEPAAARRQGVVLAKSGEPAPPAPADPQAKINPLVQQLIAADPARPVAVLVTFNDPAAMPRFPEPPSGARGGGLHRPYSDRRAQIVRAIEARRAEDREPLVLLQGIGAAVAERFWLINGFRITVAAGALTGLARHPRVLAIDPAIAEIGPPVVPPFAVDADQGNDVDDGRAIIRSDPYRALGLNDGYIAVLDTGVRPTHLVFRNPNNIDVLGDCVLGGRTCAAGAINTSDSSPPHGTQTTSIIAAGSGGGEAFRGVTESTVDVFRIYNRPSDGDVRFDSLNLGATVRAMERALTLGDRVIAVQVQLISTNSFDSLALAADAAFDSGAVVVVAAGNRGIGGQSVASPAIAHKALAIGRTDIRSAGPHPRSLGGPTPDGRIKPDVHAPSDTETASGSTDSFFSWFDGTSGATPYAAGAAALLRNWLKQFGAIDPGQVYAQMILSGRRTGAVNNVNGAGLLALPVYGTTWWGKTDVSNAETIELKLGVAAGTTALDAALWWPEGRDPAPGLAEQHSDIDLRLIDPAGVVRAAGLSTTSIWERVRVTGPLTPGVWTLQIYGYRTSAPARTVYWSAFAAHN